MRKLKTADLFAAFRVIKAIGAKEEMRKFAEDTLKVGKTQAEVGLELILELIANCGNANAEKAIYEFLSAPLETSADELKEMDLIDFGNLIKEYIKFVDSEEWRAFFTSLGELMTKQMS